MAVLDLKRSPNPKVQRYINPPCSPRTFQCVFDTRDLSLLPIGSANAIDYNRFSCIPMAPRTNTRKKSGDGVRKLNVILRAEPEKNYDKSKFMGGMVKLLRETD